MISCRVLKWIKFTFDWKIYCNQTIIQDDFISRFPWDELIRGTYYCVQLVLTTTLFITYIWQILVQSKKFCDNEALANLFKISCKWIKVLKNGLQCLFIENIHFPSEKSCNYRSISNSTKKFYSILVDTANHLSQSIKIKQISVFFICDFMKILLTNLLYIT